MMIAVISSINIIFLLILWQVLWKRHALDTMRSDLFELRSKLFKLATEKKCLTFDDKLYKSFETIINGTIRFGHSLSLLNSILFHILNRKTSSDTDLIEETFSTFNKSLKKCKDESVKDEIIKFENQFKSIIVFYLFKTSIVFLAIGFLFSIAYCFKELLSWLIDKTSDFALREKVESKCYSLVQNVEKQAVAI